MILLVTAGRAARFAAVRNAIVVPAGDPDVHGNTVV
jgi:hypothetical protein